MITTTHLHAWRCANPKCSSRLTGRGAVIMRGPEAPGWVGEGYCRHCKSFTLVVVTEGGVEYRVRQT